jgi:methylthioribose-1-phosphate isomerase
MKPTPVSNPDVRANADQRSAASHPQPSNVRTLVWHGNALELIDQRILPGVFETLRCHTAAEVAQCIRDMVVRGAPAIGCAAAFGIALEAKRLSASSARSAFLRDQLEPAFDILAASRPTAVNLFWALDRMRAALAEAAAEPVEAVVSRLEAAAIQIHDDDIAGNRAMGAAGAHLIPNGARIMTHCNAGALATAGHGTALGVIRSARDAGKAVSVIANETRPFLQGARLTAWEMVQEGIPVTLITDNMAAHLMRTGAVDLVIVGADRIAANGDVANKIGTYGLAVLAAHHGLPFYVAAPLSTFDRSMADGDRIPIEERSGEEILGYGTLRWAPAGVATRHPAFDITPAALITALITEKGVVERPDRQGIERLFTA